MSNNRKRNMKKLARNIITGTALAVGGLTQQTSASGTTEAETQTVNSGGNTASTVAAVVLPTTLTLASLGASYMQYKGNKELTEKGQAESARHNKWEEDTKQAAKVEEEKKIMTDEDARKLCLNVNTLKSKVGNTDMLMPEDVNKVMREGNQMQKDILMELSTWNAAHRANAADIVVNAVLNEKSGKTLSKLVDKMCEGTFKNTGTFANNVCAVIHTGGGVATRAAHNAEIDRPTGAAGHAKRYAHVLRVGRNVTKTETAPFDEILGPTLKRLLGGTVACRLVLVPNNLNHATDITDAEDVETDVLTAASDPFTKLYTRFTDDHRALSRDAWLNANQVGIMFDTGAVTTRNAAAADSPDVLTTGGLAQGYKIIKLTDDALGKIDKDVVKELRRKISSKYWDFCDKAVVIENNQERNVEELNA